MTMNAPEDRLQEAMDAIGEFGCPICGEPAKSLMVQSSSALQLHPCHHVVLPEDALDMKRFYRELWREELQDDFPQ